MNDYIKIKLQKIKTINVCNNYRHYILSFFLLWFAYNINFLADLSGDIYGTALIPFSIIGFHSLALDQYYQFASNLNPCCNGFIQVAGHYYSAYPIVLPVIVTPFYGLLNLILYLLHIPLSPSNPNFFWIIYFFQKITASAMTALSVLIIYYILIIEFKKETAIVTTFIYGFCTLTWATSSQSLWQQCLMELLVACLMLILIKNRFLLKRKELIILGLLSGMVCLGRPSDSVLILPIILLICYYSVKEIAVYIIGILLSSFPFVCYNLMIFHSPFGGYSSLMGSFSLNSQIIWHILALLISPSRGLFFFSPILLLIFPGIFIGLKRFSGNKKIFMLGILLTFVITLLIYGSFHTWWGGWSFGPRFLVSFLPYCIFLVAITVDWILLLLVNQPNVFYTLFVIVALLMAVSFFVECVGSFHLGKRTWDATYDLNQDPDFVWNISQNQIWYTFLQGPNLRPYEFLFEHLKSGKNIYNNMSNG
jgi:hypothetical protein